MSSAICFNLGESKVLLSGNGLRPYFYLIVNAGRVILCICPSCWSVCLSDMRQQFLLRLSPHLNDLKHTTVTLYDM